MNFQKLKNMIYQNIILLGIVFINILFISLICYNYGSNGRIFIYRFISFEILIIYFITTSKAKISSFSIKNEEKILKYDENKYNKLVELRLNFIKSAYGFFSTLIFSGILFQSNILDKIVKIKFVNASFIFFILFLSGKLLCRYYLNQIKVYEKFLRCDTMFEDTLIIYFGKHLVTALICISLIFLIALFLSEI